MASHPEVSIVIPCRNEEDTIGALVAEAHSAMKTLETSYEIIVVDNASTDRSATIAREAGADVVSETEPGYGLALATGAASARGTYVLMGDADGSYNFHEALPMVALMRDGVQLVMGCRLPAGGGRIEAGAMPWTHRYLGNPMLSLLVRRLFNIPVNDIYCGMRGVARADLLALGLASSGMTYAAEMVIRAWSAGFDIREIPVTLRRDGRVHTRSHLNTLRDGWSTLVLILDLRIRLRRVRGTG